MVFSSFPFLWIFLPLTLIGALLFRKKGSNLFLLGMSLLFYSWGEPKYIVLLLLSITMNYAAGLMISGTASEKSRKFLLAAAILANLLLLGYFKYFNFFAQTINTVTGKDLIRLRSIALPIGISFYTFQSISYLIDLSRGLISVQRSWVRLALYISFFPQLVAGPIVKYKDIAEALAHRTMDSEHAAAGLERFCFGLAKKVLLANQLGYTVDSILSHPVHELSSGLCRAAAVFYTLQIYFDFSGYSDMAIGLADTLGFRFRENFDLPYSANSVRDFWRRWHISLSAWFRDYLYIPLGGNRKGRARTILNLLIVFFATGLWHGAQWNFVLWGLYHGFFLILERLLPQRKEVSRGLSLLGRVYTLAVVCIGWVFFRADNISMAMEQLRKMFTFTGNGVWQLSEFLDPSVIAVFLLSLLLSLGCGRRIRAIIEEKAAGIAAVLRAGFAIICLFLSIVMLANAAHNPFIYFRF